MNKLLMAGVAILSLVGCSSTPKVPPPDMNNITVAVVDGKSLRDVIVSSATRRHWITSVISGNKIRCTILQRSNKVEIDIIVHNGSTYDIHCVSSNIPEAKYLQWVTKLQREIAKAAQTR